MSEEPNEILQDNHAYGPTGPDEREASMASKCGIGALTIVGLSALWMSIVWVSDMIKAILT